MNFNEWYYETGKYTFGIYFGFSDLEFGVHLYLMKNYQSILIGFGPLQFYVMRG